MLIVMAALLTTTSLLLIFQFRTIQKNRLLALQSEHEKLKEYYTDLSRQSEQISSSIRTREAKAHTIFTLYDLTKDLAKSLKEEEIIEIFRGKLNEYMKCEDCKIVAHDESLDSYSDYAIFPVNTHKKALGFFAVKGITDSDKERMNILLDQLSLSLRRAWLYQEIEQLAITDSLTKLFTRRYFMERYYEEVQRAQKHDLELSFLMIDVDNFKSINDQYGHLTGDLILREVAGIIKANTREIDLAGRYGGEEFSVVFTDSSKEASIVVAERICKAVGKKAIKAYDEKFAVTISIGISTFPEDSHDPQECIDKADWSLYRAKKMGKNQVCTFGHYPEK
ncbi:GGDEF domain-containing protein [Candidatus Omnitrophota bacterium]